MHSDQEIATYLRSINKGGKVNTVLLQQRTEFHYVNYQNEFHAANINYLEQEIFEIALIEAFKEVQLVHQVQQLHSGHHSQQLFTNTLALAQDQLYHNPQQSHLNSDPSYNGHHHVWPPPPTTCSRWP